MKTSFNVGMLCAMMTVMSTLSCASPPPPSVNDGGGLSDSQYLADSADVEAIGACAARSGMCNFVTGGGCQTGRGCYRVRNTETICTNIGPGTDETTCDPANGDLDCRSGLFCDRLRRLCTPYCCGDIDCATSSTAAPRICFYDTNFPSGTGFCANSCDFYATSNMCPPAAPRCTPFRAQNGGAAFLCDLGTHEPPVAPAGACTADTDCQNGYVCAGGTCLRVCAPNNLSAHPCPASQRCVASTDPNFGACVR